MHITIHMALILSNRFVHEITEQKGSSAKMPRNVNVSIPLLDKSLPPSLICALPSRWCNCCSSFCNYTSPASEGKPPMICGVCCTSVDPVTPYYPWGPRAYMHADPTACLQAGDEIDGKHPCGRCKAPSRVRKYCQTGKSDTCDLCESCFCMKRAAFMRAGRTVLLSKPPPVTKYTSGKAPKRQRGS